MPEPAQRVPEDSPAYREFARLYDVARQLRPTGADRWNRELYATSGPGYFDQQTGAIGINENGSARDRRHRVRLPIHECTRPRWQLSPSGLAGRHGAGRTR